jgi:hypothetical protein
MMHRAAWFSIALVAVLGVGCGGSSDVGDLVFDGSTVGSGGAGGTATGGSGGAAGTTAGSGGTTQGDASLLCIPGQSIACVGAAACQGGQVCNADGRSYGTCVCGAMGGGGSDAGGSGGGAPTDGGAGATLPDGNPCVPLAGSATDVYVDQRYTGTAPTGVAACPFTTITAGMAAAATLSGTRTVHVAGATPALVYSETTRVLVGANLILLGDGPAKTKISALGNGAGAPCAVHVTGGGTLDGFTVVSPGGDGVRADALSPAPVVKNVSAIGSTGSGVVALGAIELGPNVVASNNGGQGVLSSGTSGVVHVIAGANAFDNNTMNGIDIEGATLTFEGGSASNNGFNGIRFGAAGALGTTHAITGLVAKGSNTGISSFNGQNLKIRSSTLLTNKIYGLLYNYAAGYTLDVGVVGDVGGNTFGGATVANRNVKAGIYLCKSRGAGTQTAQGDTFAVCPPTQTSLAGCDVSPAVYTDVAYAPAVAGDPVVAVACVVGP